MSQIILPETRVQLVSPSATSDLFEDMTAWIATTGVKRCRGVIVLAQQQGTFECKVGIQTATLDIELASTPVAPNAGTGIAYVTAQGKQYWDFDPTTSGNGAIASFAYFRLGILYQSTTAVLTRGDCILKATYEV